MLLCLKLSIFPLLIELWMLLQLPPSPSKNHGPSAWTYISSFKWVRPVSVLAVLYTVALLMLLSLFWKLPSTDTLLTQAQLQGHLPPPL